MYARHCVFLDFIRLEKINKKIVYHFYTLKYSRSFSSCPYRSERKKKRTYGKYSGHDNYRAFDNGDIFFKILFCLARNISARNSFTSAGGFEKRFFFVRSWAYAFIFGWVSTTARRDQGTIQRNAIFLFVI